MESRNMSFEVGQRYLGLVDHEIYVVSEIQLPGVYRAQSGGTYCVNSPLIFFRDEKTGKTHKCRLGLAQHLLFQKL